MPVWILDLWILVWIQHFFLFNSTLLDCTLKVDGFLIFTFMFLENAFSMREFFCRVYNLNIVWGLVYFGLDLGMVSFVGKAWWNPLLWVVIVDFLCKFLLSVSLEKFYSYNVIKMYCLAYLFWICFVCLKCVLGGIGCLFEYFSSWELLDVIGVIFPWSECVGSIVRAREAYSECQFHVSDFFSLVVRLFECLVIFWFSSFGLCRDKILSFSLYS